jgi:hypothetical protein
MKKDYAYMAIKEIDGDINAVVNEVKYFETHRTLASQTQKSSEDWQSTCIVIPFAKQDDLESVLSYTSIKSMYNAKHHDASVKLLKKGLEVSCIEIKEFCNDGRLDCDNPAECTKGSCGKKLLAYFKQPKNEISLLKEKEVSVGFAKWWQLATPNMFKETDTIFDAFDLYLQSESYKSIINPYIR